MKIIPIIPRRATLDAKKQAKLIKIALKNAATAAKVDFRVTTQTWKHQPQFSIDDTSRSDDYAYEITTDDEIYGYVNFGTRPHIIRPRNRKALSWIGTGYRAKTRPRQIKSNQGSNNNTIVYTKIVQHPGSEAREFDTTIAAKWQDELPKLIQQAIDSEFG